MKICPDCHQPVTTGSTMYRDKEGNTHHIGTEGGYSSHMGCPVGIEGILDNLRRAMEQGFKPEFCRTHYKYHVGKEGS